MVAAFPALLLAASLLQQDGLFPDKPGAWEQRLDPGVLSEYAVSPTAARAFNARMAGLADVLHAAGTFHPPLGFQPRLRTRWWGPQECTTGAVSCRDRPVQAQVTLLFYYFVEGADGQPSWGGEANTSVEIRVNDLDHTFVAAGTYDVIGAPYLWLPDRRRIYNTPRKTGEIDGFPVYDTLVAVISKGSRPWWVPVTREEYVASLIRFNEGELARYAGRAASPNDPYAKWVSEREQRRRTREKAYAQLKATSPAKAEEFLRTSLKMEEGMEAALKRASAAPAPVSDGAKLYRDIIAALKAELAAMSPAERRSQAWRLRREDTMADIYRSHLVAAGTEGARALISTNPDFFDRSRPRSDWQIVTVELDWRSHSFSFLAVRRLFEFMEATDWRRTAALMD